ncbi:hypothetical protein GFD22_06010 [Bifidobacterium avesanii]|uniref:Membrane associated protein n=2 Tax=Bifidobacterium avesanii TaxID=1798157 RepID=A0A7K3THF0_9BIFI|nr:hypothetical protein [Bifidobacterium avesanii]
MGYESLSSVVLVAIAVLLVLVWAPRKARKGMKDASEHRADRFSASLHLVDASSATRFSDTTPPIMKGLTMQAEQQRKASRYTPQRIARVRLLRRAAIRRRRVLVSALAAAAVLVLVLAIALKFSPLFALIPLALDAVVLALGAHASRQARAWEAEVAAVLREGAGVAQVLPQTVGKAARPAMTAQSASSSSSPSNSDDADPATDTLTAAEIRDAVDRGRAEQLAAKAARAAALAAAAPVDVAVEAPAETPAEQSEAVAPAGAVDPSSDSSHSSSEPAAVVEPAVGEPAAAAEIVEEPSDATNELERISPSHALDAFEMAASQDLISFSLGASRAGTPVESAAPESMEIKSTRQVAKAVPPTNPDFHAAEVKRDVEAPAESSDSLGVDVDAVIARRGH